MNQAKETTDESARHTGCKKRTFVTKRYPIDRWLGNSEQSCKAGGACCRFHSLVLRQEEYAEGCTRLCQIRCYSRWKQHRRAKACHLLYLNRHNGIVHTEHNHDWLEEAHNRTC
ncbi:hypothetical protein D1872_263740 [compost metagenome]